MSIAVKGNKNCPKTHLLCDWLTRMGEKFDYREYDSGTGLPELTVDGESTAPCDLKQANAALGYPVKPKRGWYDVAVIGAGPAGISAAIHAAAEGLTVVVLESYAIGGQMSSSMAIENYAGFPEPIRGDELAQRMLSQARRLGAEVLVAMPVTNITRAKDRFWVTADDTQVWAKTIVIATGAQYRMVPACDEDRFVNAGVYYGMTERDTRKDFRQVAIVGGGNSAGQAALAFGKEGKDVVLIVRHADIRQTMSEYLVQEIEKPDSRIAILESTQIVAIEHEDGVKGITVETLMADGKPHQEDIECEAVYIFAGNEPNTSWLGSLVKRDSEGRLVRDAHGLAADNIWVIGDAGTGNISRVAVAAADGAMVVAQIWKTIKEQV